jgi:hypothetical protein
MVVFPEKHYDKSLPKIKVLSAERDGNRHQKHAGQDQQRTDLPRIGDRSAP